jgi:hypothetical protein
MPIGIEGFYLVALAALILAGEHGVGERPPLLFKIAGQTLLERLFRQVKAAGANHIVLLVTALPADILAIVDRMSKEGLSIDLARNATDAADRIHPDERVLVIDGPLIVDQSWFDRLRDDAGSTLLTVAQAGGSAFERIDATDDWLGLACLDGAVLRSTASQLGDWALGPTLLRRAVQMNAKRLRFPIEGANLRGVRPTTADDVAHARAALGDTRQVETDGWLGAVLKTAVLTPLSNAKLVQNISYIRLEILSISLYIISFILIFFTSPALSCFLFAAAGLPRLLAKIVNALSISGRSIAHHIDRARFFGFPLLPVAVAWTAPRGDLWFAGLVLAGWTISQWGLIHRAPATGADCAGPVRNDAEGLALVLGVSSALGQVQIGLMFCAGLLVAEQVLRQSKITGP